MHTLLIKRTAERDMRRLPSTVFGRLYVRLLALRDDPRPQGVRKPVGALTGWRIRVGDYRILYQVE